ncbi:hypothetical protein ACIRU3_43715 [Streptomyces sp. NPDC101151]|uniref:hypothetical protein n=1 Tax=Streptomyces sp. NPDC101151 TaxID=3366115 RepID=UPI00382DB437
MIWGSGTSNGRGPRYTEAALSDPGMPRVLRTTREVPDHVPVLALCHAVRGGGGCCTRLLYSRRDRPMAWSAGPRAGTSVLPADSATGVGPSPQAPARSASLRRQIHGSRCRSWKLRVSRRAGGVVRSVVHQKR